MSGDPFSIGNDRKKRKRRTRRQRRSAFEDLQTNILENETLSEQSRQEFLGDLEPFDELLASDINQSKSRSPSGAERYTPGSESLNLLQEVEGQLQRAEAGDPKFKSRQETEKLFEVAVDQPGSRQTRLASGTNRNNILGI